MEPEAEGAVHGGLLVARRLRAHGVSTLFTLSGGHLFSIYDGCRAEGIAIVDVRHEASAVFAAEGWAKVTRTPGVAALTAGPGVTNGISPLAAASSSGAPVLVLGGRAPAFRWGQGSLQEIDHVPLVAPVTRLAATAGSPAEIPGLVDRALAAAHGPPSGPAFVDFPLDHVFSLAAPGDAPPLPAPAPSPPDGEGLERAGALLRHARRPVVMAGNGLYWARAEEALRALAEERSVPVFLNGMARGCLPPGHPRFLSRARSTGLREADVALVIGTPLDFRLGFGAVFGPGTEIVTVDRSPPERPPARAPAAALHGAVGEILDALREAAAGGPDRGGWLALLAGEEERLRAAERPQLTDDRAPLHPMRIYGELARLLEPDAIVIGDGGDFVSFAGRVLDTHRPGCWLDPGPYGCLGCGPGYALAARLAHPARQVVMLLGDGAFGFSAMEYDTLVRHGADVVGIIGNNGIWGLEKHPMEAIYGYSVAADLRPATRYDLVAQALGAHAELVARPVELRPALERALGAGRPALVNVLTDPAVAYPRRSSLA